MIDQALLRHLDRRKLLRYAGQFALLLPLARSLLATRALGATGPTRLLCCYFPNGVHRPSFFPTQAGNGLTFPVITQALASHAADVLFIKDMFRVAQGSHEQGAMNLYTGCTSPNEVKTLGQGSLFNYVAEKMGQKSVNLGVASSLWGDSYDKTVSFNKDATVAFVEDNPEAAFAKLFGGHISGGEMSADELAYLRKARKSVLDSNLGDLAALRKKVSGDERLKLDQHIEDLRSLEKKLLEGSATGGAPELSSCAPTTNLLGGFQIPANDYNYPSFKQRNENFGRISKIMIDLMVQALACGVTRAGFLQWSCTVSPIEMSFPGGPGVAGSHHDISHYGGNPGNFNKNQTWYMEQFAYLINALKQIKEGDGTLLNSVFGMVGTCINDGDAHGSENMPYFLFGQGNGALKGGRVISINKPHNQLLIAALQAMGINENTFGNKDAANRPAAGLAA